jgi:hypothetical protein
MKVDQLRWRGMHVGNVARGGWLGWLLGHAPVLAHAWLRFSGGLVLVSLSALADSAASEVLRQALDAQGGEAALRAVTSVSWQATGYRNMVEQSERPEGPYLTEFDELTEVHDLEQQRLRRVINATVYPFGPFSQGVVADGDAAIKLNGTTAAGGNPLLWQSAQESLALSPERLLLTALEARDARREADLVLQGVPQQVVRFTLHEAPVRLFLNRETHLPTAFEYSGPLARAGFSSFLGDVTQRTWFSFWSLEANGLRFPFQWNTENNGLPDRLIHLHDLRVNAPIVEADFAISPELRAEFKRASVPDRDATPLGLPNDPPTELAAGVVLIPGSWNTTIIRQDDGLVVLEAPIASGYSLKVIDEAKRRFPGLRIKAVITTSDAWPHLAGIRQYVAQDIPVYALNLNRSILERVIRMPYSSRPDAQHRRPRKPVFQLISGKVVLGTGPNRLELFPLKGETTERQLMVYFPQHRLLYGSDAFQGNPKGGYFTPQAVSELLDAAKREHLEVDTFFMMHLGPTPWAALTK